MLGLPCSGKTTLARELEQKYSALRLTTDESRSQSAGMVLDIRTTFNRGVGILNR
jgi:predicted kinase